MWGASVMYAGRVRYFFTGKPGCIFCAQEKQESAARGDGLHLATHRIPVDCWTPEDQARVDRVTTERMERVLDGACPRCAGDRKVSVWIEGYDRYSSVPCPACHSELEIRAWAAKRAAKEYAYCVELVEGAR